MNENQKPIPCPICQKLPEITEVGDKKKIKTITCGCPSGASIWGFDGTDAGIIEAWNRRIASATEPPKDYIDAEPCPYCGAKPEMTVSSLCYPFESFDFGCCQAFLEYSEDLVTHSIQISRHDKDELVPKWNELVNSITKKEAKK